MCALTLMRASTRTALGGSPRKRFPSLKRTGQMPSPLKLVITNSETLDPQMLPGGRNRRSQFINRILRC